MSTDQEWKKCSSCKKSIPLDTKYYKCSVSTCNSKRVGYSFCSVGCFDQHIPMAKHKSAGAIEETSPKTKEDTPAARPKRRIITNNNKLTEPSNKQVSKGGDILVIASRFKDFINEQSEFSTSSSVMNAISDHLRHIAMQAIDNAREEGRRTVMEQDLKFLDKLNLNI